MKDKLMQIGLSEQEAGVYLQLLKAKKQTANEVAKQSKINRSVVYSVLDKLIDKGLVNYVLIDNTRRFSASNPNALADFLNDKKKILSNILPQLKSITEQEKEIVSVEVFQGVKGGLAILKDIIRENKDYVSFGDEGNFQKILGTIGEQYVRQLNEKDISEKIITRKGTELIGNSKKAEIKYLPEEFRFPTITTIYADKVAIAIFDKPYYVILIKSKSLAFAYRSLFEGLWKIAR